MSTWTTLEWQKTPGFHHTACPREFFLRGIHNFWVDGNRHRFWVDGYLNDWIKFTVNLIYLKPRSSSRDNWQICLGQVVSILNVSITCYCFLFVFLFLHTRVVGIVIWSIVNFSYNESDLYSFKKPHCVKIGVNLFSLPANEFCLDYSF